MIAEEQCEMEHCFLPKGHDGLHKVAARVYDLVEDNPKVVGLTAEEKLNELV